MGHIKETLISTCLVALLSLSPTAAYAESEPKMSVDSLVEQVEVVKVFILCYFPLYLEKLVHQLHY